MGNKETKLENLARANSNLTNAIVAIQNYLEENSISKGVVYDTIPMIQNLDFERQCIMDILGKEDDFKSCCDSREPRNLLASLERCYCEHLRVSIDTYLYLVDINDDSTCDYLKDNDYENICSWIKMNLLYWEDNIRIILIDSFKELI